MYTLVTGAAGYIGGNVARLLLQQGKTLILLDKVENQVIQDLRRYGNFIFVRLDLTNYDDVEKLFIDYHISEVLHFAAYISVPESVTAPMKYYTNNTAHTINLIACAVSQGTEKFIFSSTAAVYGFSDTLVTEDDVKHPLNPYGNSKLLSEKVLIDAAKNSPNFKIVILRYFNVAGAVEEEGNYYFGHRSDAQHLIKMASEAACGKRPALTIFGDDFPTPDGTGVRDYIHVVDLSQAHLRALDYLNDHKEGIFNVGYGRGYSVKEVTDVMKQVSGVDFPVTVASRRAGDPAKVVSDNSRLISAMGNFFQYNDLAVICRSAYEWEKKLA